MNDKIRKAIDLLESNHIKHKVVKMPKPAVRARDVMDINPSIIVKTIMFKTKKGNRFSVSVRSTDRISYRKVRELVKDKVSTLHPEEMLELGWEAGECCPLTVPGPLYVDPSVFELEMAHSGSGDLMYGLEYPPEAIRQLRDDVTVVDVKE